MYYAKVIFDEGIRWVDKEFRKWITKYGKSIRKHDSDGHQVFIFKCTEEAEVIGIYKSVANLMTKRLRERWPRFASSNRKEWERGKEL